MVTAVQSGFGPEGTIGARGNMHRNVIGEITGLALLVCVWAESTATSPRGEARRHLNTRSLNAYEHGTGIALLGNIMTTVVCKET